METLDELLHAYAGNDPGHRGPHACKAIADRALVELGQFLGHELTEDQHANSLFEDGFSIDVRGRPIGCAPLQLGVRAILGAEEMDVGSPELLIRAWLFFYVAESRVASTEGECMELHYRAGEGWQMFGWQWGEPGEYDAFMRFS